MAQSLRDCDEYFRKKFFSWHVSEIHCEYKWTKCEIPLLSKLMKMWLLQKDAPDAHLVCQFMSRVQEFSLHFKIAATGSHSILFSLITHDTLAITRLKDNYDVLQACQNREGQMNFFVKFFLVPGGRGVEKSARRTTRRAAQVSSDEITFVKMCLP